MTIRIPTAISIPDHYLAKSADVIVYREGEKAVAVDRSGDKIAESIDHAAVLQEAIDYGADNENPGLVKVVGTLSKVFVTITKPVHIDLQGAKLVGDGVNPVIKISTGPTQHTYPVIVGGIIDGNNRGSDGIVIEDSYHVMIYGTYIQNCRYSINPRLVNYWTESLHLIGVSIKNCERGIFFENVGSSYKSFGQARIWADIGGCDYGIYIGQNASVYRSWIDAMIWIPDNGVGVYNDGESPFARWFLRLESQSNTAKGIVLGSNYAGDMVAYARFYGNFTYIDNPYNKKIIIFYNENEVRIPAGVFGEALKIRDINGNDILSINKSVADEPVIGVFNKTLRVYDYANARDGDLRARRLIASEAVITRVDVGDYGGNFANYMPSPAVEGAIIIAIDTNSTAPGKRLYVYANGAWHYIDLT